MRLDAGNATATRYVLGIDGGQTSTKAALATVDGEVVLRVETTAWDTTHSRPGRLKCRAALNSIKQQMQSLIDTGTIAAVCIGMTGGSSGREIAVRWAKAGFGCKSVTVLPDMVVNLRGANPVDGTGVVVVAGGGSVAWGRTSDGSEAMAGGYGYILGDEGSAYEIGRQAIVSALQAFQARTPATALTHEVLEHFGVEKVWDARMLVYSGGDLREQISALAPRVARAAEAGDEAAVQIVLRAGNELASMAQAVISRLDLAAARVFPTGGVLSDGSPVRRAFAAALRGMSPEAEVRKPTMPPLGGALVIALASTGALNDESLARVTSAFTPAVSV